VKLLVAQLLSKTFTSSNIAQLYAREMHSNCVQFDSEPVHWLHDWGFTWFSAVPQRKVLRNYLD